MAKSSAKTPAPPVDTDRLDEIAEELYAAPVEDFVTIRAEHATAARKAGQRLLATAITALRKPTRSAWVVNLLARQAADDLQGLLDLGDALREAQDALSGPDLRRLSAQRHRAVEALAKRAAALSVDQGVSVSEAVRRDVVQSLQAALASPEIAEQVSAARLAQIPTYGGFGPFSPDAASAPSTSEPATATKPSTRKAAATEAEKPDDEAEEFERRRLAKERERLRAEAQTAVEQAEDASARAETEVNDAESELDDLREAVTQAQAALERAEAEAEAGAKRSRTAVEQQQRARADEEAARARLAELDD